VRIAELLGRVGEEFPQQVLVVFAQQRRASPPGFVLQGRRVAGFRIGLDPVVDTLPGYAEHTGDVGGRAPEVKLQDSEGPPEEADVRSPGELAPEALTLPGSQAERAHGHHLNR